MSNLKDYMKGGLLQNTGGRDGAARVDIQDVFLLHTARPYGSGRNRRLAKVAASAVHVEYTLYTPNGMENEHS
jgi:hypothetical protein